MASAIFSNFWANFGLVLFPSTTAGVSEASFYECTYGRLLLEYYFSFVPSYDTQDLCWYVTPFVWIFREIWDMLRGTYKV